MFDQTQKNNEAGNKAISGISYAIFAIILIVIPNIF